MSKRFKKCRPCSLGRVKPPPSALFERVFFLIERTCNLHLPCACTLLWQLLGEICSNKIALAAWIRLNPIPNGTFSTKTKQHHPIWSYFYSVAYRGYLQKGLIQCCNALLMGTIFTICDFPKFFNLVILYCLNNASLLFKTQTTSINQSMTKDLIW